MLALGAGAATLAMEISVSNLQGGRLVQRPRERLLAEFDLECIVLLRARLGECRIGGGLDAGVADDLPAQRLLGGPGAPRHSGDTAERYARVGHVSIAQVERHGGGGEGELVGLAVANLEI